MECQTCSENLSAFLDGELAGTDQDLVGKHLEICMACEEEYRSLLYSYELVDKFGELELKPELWERVRVRTTLAPVFREEPAGLFASLSLRSWFPLAATSGLAAVILIFFVYLWPFGQGTSEAQHRLQSYVQERDQAEIEHINLLKHPQRARLRSIHYNPFEDHNHETTQNPFTLE